MFQSVNNLCQHQCDAVWSTLFNLLSVLALFYKYIITFYNYSMCQSDPQDGKCRVQSCTT